MATILIHYFTGTGNTAHAVKLISERLHASGHDVGTLQVKKNVNPPAEVYDYHIIAFPVLSWSAPVMMKRYIRKMPRVNGAKTAILAVKGAIIQKDKLILGYTGQALEQVKNMLNRKNYDVFLTSDAAFPDNWTQLTNPCSVQDTKAIFPVGEADVQTFIEKFLAEKKELYYCNTFNRTWSYLVAGLFGKIGRRMLGKFYIADERCTGCKICAASCPAGTITMWRKKPRWSTTCEDCNRCINVCPERAIQVSLPLFILQTIINAGLTVWAIWAVLAYTPKWPWPNHFTLVSAEILFIIAATFIVLWVNVVPIDALFLLSAQIPVIRRFFSISHTRKYRRYMAPGFKPLEK
jgi:Pyruvate/2-oxoacid:ferredoxin oxidoreductase delta subunit